MGLRSSILDQLRAQINTLYGPSGSNAHWFRAVEVGPWNPSAGISRPRCIVEDDGCRAENQLVEGTELALKVNLVLELEENWRSSSTLAFWQDAIEVLVAELTHWLPTNVGAVAVNFIDDEPMNAVLADGASFGVWMVSFEVRYLQESL